jgi:hypothetical protein
MDMGTSASNCDLRAIKFVLLEACGAQFAAI